MGKKGKKKQEEEPEEEIPEEFRDLSIPMLTEKIQGLQYRLVKVAKERNYMQLENDMVHRFYEITKHEVKQCEAEIGNKCSKMEMIERDHRTHLKVHEQKVLNLEYEHKNNRRLVLADGEESIAAEKEVHKRKITALNTAKDGLKQDGQGRKLADQSDLAMLKVGFERNLKKLRETFEANHGTLEKNYEDQIAELKRDLELKRKCEMHEIEERKNQHINDLLFNHQEAFDQIKGYYNDITHDNLQLIKSLKDEIAEMKDYERTNLQRMKSLTLGNQNLAEPLKQKEQTRQELQNQLKSYGKDKLALKNLIARTQMLDTEIKEANGHWRIANDKFSKLEKERDDLYNEFAKGVADVKKRSEYKNVVLERKLELLQGEFEQKQVQLSEVLASAKLDPNVVQNVTQKLEGLLQQKNTLCKDLEYQIHLASKQFNDTLRVFEKKLVDFGVPVEEIGVEPIVDIVSQMPAGLVTKR
mmetsp:Transcript_15795/g.39097  ORF Transcript_15795/g.39097 Transcript_15795/m.39097 type:complete len:471 (+) Transcript_15795:270-1682(+)